MLICTKFLPPSPELPASGKTSGLDLLELLALIEGITADPNLVEAYVV